MKTTAGATGIATSLEVDGATYLVSTILRDDIGCFQTMVLKYPERSVAYRIERIDQQDAVDEHIDSVNMVLNVPPNHWDDSKPYQNVTMEWLEMAAGSKYLSKLTATDLMREPWGSPNIVGKLKKANLNPQTVSSFVDKFSRITSRFKVISPFNMKVLVISFVLWALIYYWLIFKWHTNGFSYLVKLGVLLAVGIYGAIIAKDIITAIYFSVTLGRRLEETKKELDARSKE